MAIKLIKDSNPRIMGVVSIDQDEVMSLRTLIARFTLEHIVSLFFSDARLQREFLAELPPRVLGGTITNIGIDGVPTLSEDLYLLQELSYNDVFGRPSYPSSTLITSGIPLAKNEVHTFLGTTQSIDNLIMWSEESPRLRLDFELGQFELGQ